MSKIDGLVKNQIPCISISSPIDVTAIKNLLLCFLRLFAAISILNLKFFAKSRQAILIKFNNHQGDIILLGFSPPIVGHRFEDRLADSFCSS